MRGKERTGQGQRLDESELKRKRRRMKERLSLGDKMIDRLALCSMATHTQCIEVIIIITVIRPSDTGTVQSERAKKRKTSHITN